MYSDIIALIIIIIMQEPYNVEKKVAERKVTIQVDEDGKEKVMKESSRV